MKTPLLILIHGYPFDHTMWDRVIAELDGLKIVAPDLPGFGVNPVLTAEPSLEQFADGIAAILDSHGEKSGVIAGMSMGGYVALAFAERHPERLAGLGLLNSQTVADTEEAIRGRREMITKIRRDGPSVASEAMIPKLFFSGEKSLAVYVEEGARRAGADGLCWALEAMARRPDRSVIAATLKIPALVLHGLEDKLIPAERARRLAAEMPDARLVEIPGAGHGSPLEAPSIVAGALRDLVRNAGDPAA